MKKLKSVLLVVLSLFLGWNVAFAAPAEANLTIHVMGIRNNNGVIRMALFNSEQTYNSKTPNAADAYARAKLPITDGTAVFEFKSVPYGTYAVKLYQDEDNSGKLKKTFTGRPTEGIGFSNNPKLDHRAPNFDETKFTINEPNTEITIQMINPK
jgi:uncharacterized protein (DUF2141 family)